MTDPRQCLYISDLDGTLLDRNSELPAAAAGRLNRLLDKGLNFTVATARNYYSVLPLLRGLRLRIPVILFNGVYLTDFQTGQNLLMSNCISRPVVENLLGLAGGRSIDPFVYSYGNGHTVYYRNVTNAGSRNYLREIGGSNRFLRVEEYDTARMGNVSGLLFIDELSMLAPLHGALRENFSAHLNVYFAEDICVAGHYWLQIYHQNANKGNMVQTLARRMGLPLSQVVVFGDYLNDLEMFRVAGEAVAMENALPEVKAAAHKVIGGNDRYAVIEYLESLFD